MHRRAMKLPSVRHVPNTDLRLWTIQDAANYLSVSARTVERARSKGEFPPAVRIGRAVRFDASAIVAWAFGGQEVA